MASLGRDSVKTAKMFDDNQSVIKTLTANGLPCYDAISTNEALGRGIMTISNLSLSLPLTPKPLALRVTSMTSAMSSITSAVKSHSSAIGWWRKTSPILKDDGRFLRWQAFHPLRSNAPRWRNSPYPLG